MQAMVHDKFVARSMLAGKPRIRLDSVNSLGMWDRLSVHRLVQQIETFAPDIMHSHMARGAWAGGKAVERAGAPLISTTHNYVDLKYYRGVHCFVPTTLDQQRYLHEAGVAVERIRRIPNFSMLAPASAPVVRPTDAVRFVSFGRFVHKKGFAVLLDAFAKARQRGLSASTLAIGGDGPLAGALRKQSRALGLDDCVRFGGWIDDVEAYLRQGDVFVLPSLDEPFGIVMLEAMASGRPIVTTRTQGPREVLDDSCAFFAEIGDVDTLTAGLLNVALKADEACARAAEALSRYRRLYHRDAVVPQILELYAHVLAQP